MFHIYLKCFAVIQDQVFQIRENVSEILVYLQCVRGLSRIMSMSSADFFRRINNWNFTFLSPVDTMEMDEFNEDEKS